jgi:hypothetical protein
MMQNILEGINKSATNSCSSGGSDSDMDNLENQIIIDEEFKSLLPELDKETYSALEENILQHGCRDVIILWDGILIDGHNRYQICLQHDIPFSTIEMEFESRETVII